MSVARNIKVEIAADLDLRVLKVRTCVVWPRWWRPRLAHKVLLLLPGRNEVWVTPADTVTINYRLHHPQPGLLDQDELLADPFRNDPDRINP